MKGYKDGIKAFSSRSNPNDPFHAMQVQRFDGKHWKLVGDVVQKPH